MRLKFISIFTQKNRRVEDTKVATAEPLDKLLVKMFVEKYQ